MPSPKFWFLRAWTWVVAMDAPVITLEAHPVASGRNFICTHQFTDWLSIWHSPCLVANTKGTFILSPSTELDFVGFCMMTFQGSALLPGFWATVLDPKAVCDQSLGGSFYRFGNGKNRSSFDLTLGLWNLIHRRVYEKWSNMGEGRQKEPTQT